MLSDPNLVTDKDCEKFITIRGKGWVCEIEGTIIAFAIADLQENNIWALFVDPTFESQGIAKQLQKLVLDWYFKQGKDFVWLGTAPNTRAEKFYQNSGWKRNCYNGAKEVKFEITKSAYKELYA